MFKPLSPNNTLGGTMPQTVKLPDTVYQDLVSISEELSNIAKKPISLGMAVYLLTEVYRAHLRDPCARDAFRQKLASSDIMTPEEFEKAWDLTPTKTRGSGKKGQG
jgi:hypothetical protein